MNKLGRQLDHRLLAHIQGALDYSPAAIIIAAAPSGEILYINEAVRKFRGDTELPLTGIQLEHYMMSWTEYDANGRQLSGEEMPLGVALTKGRVVENQEVIVELDDGTRKWALASAAPIFDDDGVIIAASVIWYDITERKQLEVRLKQEADFDCLTGVFSRHRFMESATRVLERSQRNCQPVSILMFDLDYFKDVNDFYGHPAGDEVLRSFAGIIKRGVRPSDIIGRIGGEEFMLILQGADLDIGMRTAEKLLHEVERAPITTETGEVSITTSIGVTSPALLQQQLGHFPSLDELLANADEALYQAKHKGRNCVETTLFHA